MGIKKIALRMWLAWSGFWFVTSFIILFPFFWLSIVVPGWAGYSVQVNYIWSKFFFPVSLIRVRKRFSFRPSAKFTCVYCVNHGSYLDIPTLVYVLPGFFAFIGKNSLAKIPLFGYMFANLHITVNRASASASSQAFKQALAVLQAGRSLVIFPEGRIDHTIQPSIAPFKDGAFRMAIAAGVPIVPVIISKNWKILPDDGRFLPTFSSTDVIILPPIHTTSLSQENVSELRKQVYEQMSEVLSSYNIGEA